MGDSDEPIILLRLNPALLDIIFPPTRQPSWLPTPVFGITARAEKFQTKVRILLSGTAFTPGGRVDVHYMHVPGILDLVNVPASGRPAVEPDGSFTDFPSQNFDLVHLTGDDAFADVWIHARDDATGNFAITRLTAAYWGA